MKKVFVVSYTYQEFGGRAVNRVVGVTKTLDEAKVMLDKAKGHILETLYPTTIDEEYSVVEDKHFLLTDNNDEFFAEGFIDEREIGKVVFED